jgi:AraC-like DNA-binding protein
MPGLGLACVWSDTRRRSRVQRVLPDGCIDILWSPAEGTLQVAGPDTKARLVPLAGHAPLVAVRFLPGYAPAVLGIPADALRDTTVPLEDLWGPGARELAEALTAAPFAARPLPAGRRVTLPADARAGTRPAPLAATPHPALPTDLQSGSHPADTRAIFPNDSGAPRAAGARTGTAPSTHRAPTANDPATRHANTSASLPANARTGSAPSTHLTPTANAHTPLPANAKAGPTPDTGLPPPSNTHAHLASSPRTAFPANAGGGTLTTNTAAAIPSSTGTAHGPYRSPTASGRYDGTPGAEGGVGVVETDGGTDGDGRRAEALLQRAVAARVTAADPVVVATVMALRAGWGVAETADGLGVSERQLRRRCLAGFGYGPKTLQRILRFQRALALTRSGMAAADAAVTAGYADQAHLAHEVRGLAGVAMGDLM